MNLAVLLLLALSIGIAVYLTLWHRRVIVDFGLLALESDRAYRLLESTSRIPFRPGPDFRFGVTFYAPSGRRFKARVDHVLPSRPTQYGSDAEKVSGELEDGRFRMECNEVDCPGAGCRALYSSVGDPLGSYEAHVFIDGRRKAIIRYEVVGDAV